MRWSRWSHREAVGHGTDLTGGEDCVVVSKRPVTVTLTRPRRYCGHWIFTRARFEFPEDPTRDYSQKSIYYTDC